MLFDRKHVARLAVPLAVSLLSTSNATAQDSEVEPGAPTPSMRSSTPTSSATSTSSQLAQPILSDRRTD